MSGIKNSKMVMVGVLGLSLSLAACDRSFKAKGLKPKADSSKTKSLDKAAVQTDKQMDEFLSVNWDIKDSSGNAMEVKKIFSQEAVLKNGVIGMDLSVLNLGDGAFQPKVSVINKETARHDVEGAIRITKSASIIGSAANAKDMFSSSQVLDIRQESIQIANDSSFEILNSELEQIALATEIRVRCTDVGCKRAFVLVRDQNDLLAGYIFELDKDLATGNKHVVSTYRLVRSLGETVSEDRILSIANAQAELIRAKMTSN